MRVQLEGVSAENLVALFDQQIQLWHSTIGENCSSIHSGKVDWNVLNPEHDKREMKSPHLSVGAIGLSPL